MVNGQLIDAIVEIETMGKDYDDSTKLEQFIDTLKNYNENIDIDDEFTHKLWSFFSYKWSTDKQ